MILITGASGNAGGAVLRSALELKLPVRALYRNKDDAKHAPKGIDIVYADYSDKTGLSAALRDIESLYLVCGPIPQLVELENNAINASKAAGVRHIVLNSALGAGKFNKSFPSWHAKVENSLTAGGIDYTIIRPNGFMQNIGTYNSASIRADKAFYAAMGDAKTSLIDVRDVGDAVASILSAPRNHRGRTYELNGPEALTNEQIAKRISETLGWKVSYVDIPEEAQRKSMLDMGMPEWQVNAILELQEYYRSGDCAVVDDTVEKLTGKKPRTLDAYLKENKSIFQTKAA